MIRSFSSLRTIFFTICFIVLNIKSENLSGYVQKSDSLHVTKYIILTKYKTVVIKMNLIYSIVILLVLAVLCSAVLNGS